MNMTNVIENRDQGEMFLLYFIIKSLLVAAMTRTSVLRAEDEPTLIYSPLSSTRNNLTCVEAAFHQFRRGEWFHHLQFRNTRDAYLRHW